VGKVTVATRIEAPAEEVWNLLCKINRYAKWDAFADEILSASVSRLKLGSTYDERSGTERSSWQVTSFDPPRRQVHTGTVGFMGEVTREFVVEPAGERAELRQTISFTVMPGFTRPFGLLAEKLFVERMVRKRLTQSGEGLKAALAE
jgi:hypothetical protein